MVRPRFQSKEEEGTASGIGKISFLLERKSLLLFRNSQAFITATTSPHGNPIEATLFAQIVVGDDGTF